MIHFTRDVCSDFSLATSKEWLETNGIGGFASSTILGCNTRRYHGLLVAALNPPTARTVLLSKLEETLTVDTITYPLSTNQYPGIVHPSGYLFLDSFRLDPFPIFTYQVGGVTLEKEIFMPHEMNAVALNYRLIQPKKNVQLAIRPMIAGRDFHHLNRQSSVQIDWESHENALIVKLGWGAHLYLYFSQGNFTSDPQWFYTFEYQREQERGLDYQEDLFAPGVLSLPISSEGAWLVASSEPLTPEPQRWRSAEIKRRQALVKGWADEPEAIQTLVKTADSFFVKRPQEMWDIVAGYHWFEEWGRDAMIALPGLCLATGKLDVARGVLKYYARECQEGLLPNCFMEPDGIPSYNCVDAALWFVHVIGLLAGYRGQKSFVQQQLLPIACQIIQRYMDGTRYGIHMDSDGLITIGEEGGQLTWMDAKVGDVTITPRHGKPIEIQALWYNALRVIEQLGENRWSETAKRAQESFATAFWNEAESCLYDRITDQGPDAAIRPNQAFALSLPYPILDKERGRLVLQTIEKDLLTPYGLRTLSPRDSRYRGRYEGDVWSRDSAYHQGTVWPWLIGPYISAYLYVYENSTEAKAHCRGLLQPLFDHLNDAGLGSIAEIFDGDSPHRPVGCISQAWSVGEVLRVWREL